MNFWQEGLEGPLLKFIKNPSDIGSIQEMYQIFSRSSDFQSAVSEKILKNLEFKKMFEEWYCPQAIELQTLLSFEANTLGSLYAKHIIENKLDLHYISEFSKKNILTYLWMRAKQTHDVSHVLTGFDTSFTGEIALKGFELAQYSSPSTAATASAGLLALTLLSPQGVDAAFQSFIRGYQLGQQWPLLMAIPFEKYWSMPVDDFKKQMALGAV